MVATKAVVRLLARAVILSGALTLIVTAANKIQDPGALLEDLKVHDIIPVMALDIAPYLVIAIEMLVGVATLWSAMHQRWRSGALSASALLACFALYAWALVIRPPAAPSGCGCGFSSGLVDDWTPIALRNTMMSALLAASAGLLTTRAT